jgi:hypothetical protein
MLLKLHNQYRIYIHEATKIKDLVPFYRETKISLIQGIVLLKLSNYFYSVTIL